MISRARLKLRQRICQSLREFAYLAKIRRQAVVVILESCHHHHRNQLKNWRIISDWTSNDEINKCMTIYSKLLTSFSTNIIS